MENKHNCSIRPAKDTKMYLFGYRVRDISLVDNKKTGGGFIAISRDESVVKKG